MILPTKRLPDSELEVMLALWNSGGSAARAEFEPYLAARGWSATTVNTYLTRLLDKGFVRCERRGKANVYTPLISREAYCAFESESVLDRLYASSVSSFVASFCHSRPISDRQLDELQQLLDRLKEGNADA
ncbi:MAG: BlaI/MecI/CopY family transcriptional regulator [Oscillospiraceae bacterium]